MLRVPLFFLALAVACTPRAPREGFSNQGEVGVGRAPAYLLSGIFSDVADLILCDGAQDLRPRLRPPAVSFLPNEAAAPNPPTPVSFPNSSPTIFAGRTGAAFTGCDANGDASVFPPFAVSSPGGHAFGAQTTTLQSMKPVDCVTLASVPEPGSLAVFAFALAVLGIARVARLRGKA